MADVYRSANHFSDDKMAARLVILSLARQALTVLTNGLCSAFICATASGSVGNLPGQRVLPPRNYPQPVP